MTSKSRKRWKQDSENNSEISNEDMIFLDLPLYEDSMEDMLEKHNITKLIEFEKYRPSYIGNYDNVIKN